MRTKVTTKKGDINMNTTYKPQTSVTISNTEYLRIMIQTDTQYRDRYWCIRLGEHICLMESQQGMLFKEERKLLNEVYENL